MNEEIWIVIVYNGMNKRKVRKGTYFSDVEVLFLPVRVVEENKAECR